MEPTNFNSNNQIIIQPYKAEDLTSELNRIPEHIFAEFLREFSYTDVLALATTCRYFTMKVEFLKHSWSQQIQLERKLLWGFYKETYEWLKQ